MTHEDYVSYDQAVKLKKLGFDWACVGFYNEAKISDITHYNILGEGTIIEENYNDDIIAILCSAPTLAQAQKWLREVKGIDVVVFPSYPKGEKRYHYGLYRWFPYLNYVDGEHHNIYEKALSAGLGEAIDLLIIEESK